MLKVLIEAILLSSPAVLERGCPSFFTDRSDHDQAI